MKISKVRLGKCYYEKNGLSIDVVDLTDYVPNLRMMCFQLFFKTGFAIYYLLEDTDTIVI